MGGTVGDLALSHMPALLSLGYVGIPAGEPYNGGRAHSPQEGGQAAEGEDRVDITVRWPGLRSSVFTAAEEIAESGYHAVYPGPDSGCFDWCVIYVLRFLHTTEIR